MRGVLVAVGLTLVVAVGLLVALVTTAGSQDGTPWVDLQPGDCFDLAGAVDGGDDPVFRVETVSCEEPHDAEVIATGRLDPDGVIDYPADDELFDLVDRRCLAAGSLDRDRFGLLPIAPDERTWRGRGGHYACVAVALGGGTTTGSILE